MNAVAPSFRSLLEALAGRGAALGLLAIVLSGSLPGCASWRRQKVVPDSVATCRQLSCDGVAAMQRGQWDQARDLLERAVAASPSDIEARRQLAEALWQSGAREEAATHMQAAVRLDPRHAPTVVRCGEMHLGLGAVDRALARAEESIALDATCADAWALRGRVYMQRGELDRALADMHQSLRYSPNSVGVLQETAELQYRLQRPQACLATLQHALERSPPGEQPQQALWLAGLAYAAVERHDEAAASLYAASLRGPPQPELLYQLAQAQRTTGRHAEAAVTVRQALAADGSHEPSRLLLAQLEGDAGEATAPIRR